MSLDKTTENCFPMEGTILFNDYSSLLVKGEDIVSSFKHDNCECQISTSNNLTTTPYLYLEYTDKRSDEIEFSKIILVLDKRDHKVDPEPNTSDERFISIDILSSDFTRSSKIGFMKYVMMQIMEYAYFYNNGRAHFTKRGINEFYKSIYYDFKRGMTFPFLKIFLLS